MKTSSDIQNSFDNGRYELLNGNFEESISFFSEALRWDQDHKLAWVSRGSAFLKLDNFSDAIKDFDRAIDLDPDYARAYHLRGMAKESAGDNESALNDFSRAIDIDPEYGAAYYSRATLLTKLNEEEKAMGDIEMVHRLTNRNIEIFANENNVWRSQHLKLEEMMESELDR
jgi:tetratricopeptide (TPR) repeat protein